MIQTGPGGREDLLSPKRSKTQKRQDVKSLGLAFREINDVPRNCLQRVEGVLGEKQWVLLHPPPPGQGGGCPGRSVGPQGGMQAWSPCGPVTQTREEPEWKPGGKKMSGLRSSWTWVQPQTCTFPQNCLRLRSPPTTRH